MDYVYNTAIVCWRYCLHDRQQWKATVNARHSPFLVQTVEGIGKRQSKRMHLRNSAIRSDYSFEIWNSNWKVL